MLKFVFLACGRKKSCIFAIYYLLIRLICNMKRTKLISLFATGVLPKQNQRPSRLIALMSLLVISMSAFSQTSSCPDSQHPHMIDLGLPSGTRWACCNVGADSPEGYGSYFAWGETEEKSSYTSSSYSLSADGMHDLTTDEDVAIAKWGNKWCMPRINEIEELLKRCSWSWEELNGVIGARVTGTNGESIFLPASGFKDGEDSWSNSTKGNYGSYWGRTHGTQSNYAIELIFGIVTYLGNHPSCDFYWMFGPTGVRRAGRSVRPISAENQVKDNDYTIFITNPSFDYNYFGGWNGTPWGGEGPANNAEHFNKTYDTFQTLHGLPPGKYRLGVQGFYRKGTASNDYKLWQEGDTDHNNAILYASSAVNAYSIPLVAASSAALTESLGGNVLTVGNGLCIPDNMVAAGAWFDAGYYHNYLIVEVGNDGELTIGIKKDQTIDRDWTIVDNWTLIRIDENDTDAIKDLREPTTVDDDQLYNFSGQRVSTAHKGIFIRRGKKVVFK